MFWGDSLLESCAGVPTIAPKHIGESNSQCPCSKSISYVFVNCRKIFRGNSIFQYGIIRQVATSEAPVTPQPPFLKNILKELIVTKLRGNLVVITGNYYCGVKSVVFSARGVWQKLLRNFLNHSPSMFCTLTLPYQCKSTSSKKSLCLKAHTHCLL